MEIRSIGRLACLVTVFGVGQFLLLTFLAALFYPGGYDYFGYYFSDLGAVAARNGEPNLISRTLYFVAFTIVALAFVPFWLIIRSLFPKSKVEKVLSTLGSVLGLISSPFMIGVALFPMDIQLEIHFTLALTFVSFFVLASLLYSIAIIFNQNYPNYLGLIAFVLFAVSLASSAVSFMDPNAPYGAFLQKIAVYSYFIWTLLPIYLAWPSVRSRNSRL